MKRLVLMLIIAFLATGCNGQEKAENVDKKKMGKDSGEQPRVSWDVKTETDENGNIIRYDSTYTWSYTNIDGDSIVLSADSIMNSFHSYFNKYYPPIWNRSFTQPLLKDSLFFQEFYNDDYFHNRWQQDYFEIEKMFNRMDSMRNQFFYDRYPGMLRSPKSSDEKDKK